MRVVATAAAAAAAVSVPVVIRDILTAVIFLESAVVHGDAMSATGGAAAGRGRCFRRSYLDGDGSFDCAPDGIPVAHDRLWCAESKNAIQLGRSRFELRETDLRCCCLRKQALPLPVLYLQAH